MDDIKFEAERLICCDCGQPFVFSSGEREFYYARGLASPRRCPACRQKRRLALVPDSEVRHD